MGYFVQAMYMTEWDIQPVVKYEYFDPDTDVDNSDYANDLEAMVSQATINMTFGFNYFFNDWTRFQFNYIMKDEDAADFDNDQILMQLQVKF